MAVVREGSSLGPCNVLGPLVRETKTRFVYCPHRGQIAFAQRSPRIHLEPCKCCPDHPASRYTHLYRAAATIEDWPMRAMWFWAVMQL
jgi:hypothetical protein